MENNFKVCTVCNIGNEEKLYTHWSKGLVMYLKKDGVSIELNSDEIKQLVKSLPRTIGGKY